MSKTTNICKNCNKEYSIYEHYVKSSLSRKSTPSFCSFTCMKVFRSVPYEDVECKQCGKRFSSKVKAKSKFCCRSCSTTYNNTHKTHGIRVSKLEKWIQQKLSDTYPNLEIHFNRKDAINSELDIYIPSLKLAFELNGVFHYEPIYGPEQLQKLQNNDNRKFQACLERGIELCIIDTRDQRKFTETSSNKFFIIIDNVLKTKLVP